MIDNLRLTTTATPKGLLKTTSPVTNMLQGQRDLQTVAGSCSPTDTVRQCTLADLSVERRPPSSICSRRSPTTCARHLPRMEIGEA